MCIWKSRVRIVNFVKILSVYICNFRLFQMRNSMTLIYELRSYISICSFFIFSLTFDLISYRKVSYWYTAMITIYWAVGMNAGGRYFTFADILFDIYKVCWLHYQLCCDVIVDIRWVPLGAVSLDISCCLTDGLYCLVVVNIWDI